MSLQPGQTVAQYRLLELIGEGGMGRVFRAHDTKLQRQVAIKILQPAFSADEKLRRRFLREARAAAAVSHPAIAAVHEVGEADEITYIVMEYVEGKTLRHHVGGQPLPLTEAIRIGVEIGEGLAEAHKAGVIHRDLKPDNIIIRPDRRPKILDFGIAKVLEDRGSLFRRRTSPTTTSLTGEGKVVGTLGYMSPEQARGEPVDARSDIFSFGVILFEMVAGQAPFRGRTPIDTLTSILKEPPPPVSRFNPRVHPKLEEVLAECLEKDPSKRQQRMEDVVMALRITQLAIQEAAMRRTTFEHTALKEPLPPPPEAPKRRPLFPPLLAAAGLIALVALASAGYLALRGEGPAPAPAPGPAAAPDSRRSVAVVELASPGGATEGEEVARALTGLVASDLAESGGLIVASTARMNAFVTRAGAPGGADAAVASGAAREAGANAMLFGRIDLSGSRLVVTADLVDVRSGAALASLRHEAGAADRIIDVAGAIASEVRGHLGVAASSGEGGSPFSLAEAVTSSPAAYRHFATGTALLREARWEEAVDRLRLAVEDDPSFALASLRLGLALGWAGRPGEGLEALETGRAHAERLPPRWRRTYEAAIDRWRGGADHGVEALGALSREDAAPPEADYLLAEMHVDSSRHRDLLRARDLYERAVESDPAFRRALPRLVQLHADGGDLGSARAILERFDWMEAGDPSMTEAAALLQVAEGDIEGAIARLEGALRRGREELWLPLAAVRRAAGQPAETLALCEAAAGAESDLLAALIQRAAAQSDLGAVGVALRDYEQVSSLLGGVAARARISAAAHTARARLLAALGQSTAALTAADAAVSADPWSAPALFWKGRLMIEGGRAAGAKETLSALRRMNAEASSPEGAFWESLLQAEIHREEGDLGSALAELGRASRLPASHRDQEAERLTQARVKAAFGDLHGAIEALRQGLRPRVGLLPEPGMITPLPLYELARLEEQAGEKPAAREHYARFLERWGKADPPVAAAGDARSRLRALGGS